MGGRTDLHRPQTAIDVANGGKDSSTSRHPQSAKRTSKAQPQAQRGRAETHKQAPGRNGNLRTMTRGQGPGVQWEPRPKNAETRHRRQPGAAATSAPPGSCRPRRRQPSRWPTRAQRQARPSGRTARRNPARRAPWRFGDTASADAAFLCIAGGRQPESASCLAPTMRPPGRSFIYTWQYRPKLPISYATRMRVGVQG